MALYLKSALTVTLACLALASCGPKPSENQQAAAPTVAQTDASTTTAAAAPAGVGDCVETTVASTGPRLEGVPDSGSSIQYANGLSQVEYDVLPGITHSRAGDAVRVCLVSVPQNCPPGDNRGRVYSGTNLRTNETWTAPDSQHSCGGA